MNIATPGGFPKRREPLLNIPTPIAAMALVFAAFQLASSLLGEQFDLMAWKYLAFVPIRLSLALAPDRLQAIIERANSDPKARDLVAALHFFQIGGGSKPWTLITYALLHGSWTHLGLNCVWLVAFGSPVARRLGAARTFVFSGFAAVVGALAQWGWDPMSAAPVIGASAAVSGLMGAAARFVFSRGGLAFAGPNQLPLAPLFSSLADPRVLTFIAVWLLTNLVFGVAAVDIGLSDAPVAWIAHIGGFVFGLLALPLFDRTPLAESPLRSSP
jgi:membrane associated rhomboid family serine protease